MRLEIEINSRSDKKIKSLFNQLPHVKEFRPDINNEQRQLMVKHLQHYLPSFKVGSGSSHVWISNKKNERLAIIYL